MSYPSSDRNLLFGAIALQTNFVSRDQLVAAIKEWAQRRTTPLGAILCEQNVIDADTRALIDGLVDKQLTRHDGDAEASLQALSSWQSLHDVFSEATGSDDGSGTRAEHGSHPSTIGGESWEGRTRGLNASQRYRIKGAKFIQGGLGELFLAEDTELGREVVVKEIQGRWASDAAARERFVLEAEITGGLEHPGVVPVYGLGQYADGRPFYAMRFIKGDNLKTATDRFYDPNHKFANESERVVAFRTLIGRFIDVCNAVAYAHSRGVLHRDLKPANVMLGKYGETLVVDWGLAKAIGRRQGVPKDATIGADATLRPGSGSDVSTKHGQLMGTPAYMSPEQASSKLDELGPASDVYSLGATLYSVLTGKAPFEGKATDVVPLVQIGKFRQPRAVKSDVPEALEVVCLKAMALKPEDRYGGPAELAADLEHWLADEPVSAWREPWRLKAGRWVRRHRTAAVAAVVLLATATACLSVMTWLVSTERDVALKATEEKNRQWLIAQRNFKNSLTTVRDMLQIAEDLAPGDPAALDRRKALMATIAAKVKGQIQSDPEDVGLRRLGAMVLRYQGNTLRLAHEHEEAHRCYEEAIRLLHGIDDVGATGEVPQLQAEVMTDYARSLCSSGDLSKALATSKAAVAQMGRLRQQVIYAGRDDFRITHIETLIDLSAVLYVRGDWQGTLDAADAASKLSNPKEHPGEPNDNLYRLFWGAAEYRAGAALREMGAIPLTFSRHDASVIHLNHSPSNPRLANTFRQYYGLALCEKGRSLGRAGKHADAIDAFDKAIAVYRALIAMRPGFPFYEELLAITFIDRGWASDNVEEAHWHLTEAILRLESLATLYPKIPSYQGWLGMAYLRRAELVTYDGLGSALDLVAAHRLLGDVCRRYPGNASFERGLNTARTLLP